MACKAWAEGLQSSKFADGEFEVLRQDGFKERLGSYLEEARDHDWNLMRLSFTGCCPVESCSEFVV